MPDGATIFRTNCNEEGIDIIQSSIQTLPALRIFDSLGNLLTSLPNNIFNLPTTINNTGTVLSGNNNALTISENGLPSGNSTANFVSINALSQNNNNFNIGGLFGTIFQVIKTGSGTCGTLEGLNGTVFNTGTGLVTSQIALALINDVGLGGGTSNTTMICGQFTDNIRAGATVTTSLGIQVSLSIASGTVTTREGVEIRNQGGALFTTSYGLRVLAQSGSGTTWGVMCEGGNSKFQAGAAGEVPLTVAGAGGQTANIFSVETVGGTGIFRVGLSKIGVFNNTPVVKQAGASAAGIALITDANAKAAIQAIQAALGTSGTGYGWLTSPA